MVARLAKSKPNFLGWSQIFELASTFKTKIIVADNIIFTKTFENWTAKVITFLYCLLLFRANEE